MNRNHTPQFSPDAYEKWRDIDTAELSKTEYSLALEGIKQARLLMQAGVLSLREWIDDQTSDIASGLRGLPVGIVSPDLETECGTGHFSTPKQTDASLTSAFGGEYDADAEKLKAAGWGRDDYIADQCADLKAGLRAEPDSLSNPKIKDPENLSVEFGQFDQLGFVDRLTNVISGFTVAELGAFKSGRGQFDSNALDEIVRLGNATARGLKCGLTHSSPYDDKAENHLGRVKNFRRDGSTVIADLHLSQVATNTPIGGGKPKGQWVMELIAEDPGALGASLVLAATKDYSSGSVPIWTPIQLRGCDIVADGDAVHGDLLSAT